MLLIGRVVDDRAAVFIDDHHRSAGADGRLRLAALVRIVAAPEEAADLVVVLVLRAGDGGHVAEPALAGEISDLLGGGPDVVAPRGEPAGRIDRGEHVAHAGNLVRHAPEDQRVPLRVDGEPVREIIERGGAPGCAGVVRISGVVGVVSPERNRGLRRLPDQLQRPLARDRRGDVLQFDPSELGAPVFIQQKAHERLDRVEPAGRTREHDHAQFVDVGGLAERARSRRDAGVGRAAGQSDRAPAAGRRELRLDRGLERTGAHVWRRDHARRG